MQFRASKLVMGGTLALACMAANALEEINGHITYLEPTYLPSLVQFSMDSGSASCPVGKYLKWQNTDISNNKAIYATLLAALSSGKRVRFYVDDGDATCSGKFVHALSN